MLQNKNIHSGYATTTAAYDKAMFAMHIRPENHIKMYFLVITQFHFLCANTLNVRQIAQFFLHSLYERQVFSYGNPTGELRSNWNSSRQLKAILGKISVSQDFLRKINMEKIKLN